MGGPPRQPRTRTRTSPRCSCTVADRILALRVSTRPASRAASSCNRTRPSRGRTRWPRSQRIAPVVNRIDPRVSFLAQNFGNPILGPSACPLLRVRPVTKGTGETVQAGVERLRRAPAPPRRHGVLGGVPVLAQRAQRPRDRWGPVIPGQPAGGLSGLLGKVGLHPGEGPVERQPRSSRVRPQSALPRRRCGGTRPRPAARLPATLVATSRPPGRSRLGRRPPTPGRRAAGLVPCRSARPPPGELGTRADPRRKHHQAPLAFTVAPHTTYMSSRRSQGPRNAYRHPALRPTGQR